MALYDAFVSYSHAKDKPIAAALQSVIQTLGKPWYRRRALRVFRDDTGLAATPSLWDTIEQALGQSRYLILLASPEAAASPWVNKEVAYWLDHKGADTLLIAVTDGALVWDNSIGDFTWREGMPLPPVLTGRFASEPKWVDLTAYRDGADPGDAKFTELAADLAAAIHGTPKEDLLSQEVRQQRRALRLAWSAAGSLLVLALAAGGAGVLAYQAQQKAVRAEQQAVAERDRATKAEQQAIVERDNATRNFKLAQRTADSLVVDIARGLRDVQGMRSETVRKILDTARATFERLAASAPDDLTLQRSRAGMLDEFGDTYLTLGDLAEALQAYRDSLAIRQRLTAADPSNTREQHDLSVSYNKIGDVLVVQGKLDDALKAYRDSFAIAERLAAADTSNTEWQRYLSISYDNVGDVLVAQGKLDDALKAHRDSLAIAERLAAADRSNTDLQRDRSVSYERIGDVLVEQGKLDDALKAYRDSLAIRQSLAASDPGNAQWQTDFQNSIGKIGGLAYRFVLVHHFPEALEAADQTIALAPKKIWPYANRAHALMLLGRVDEARSLYLQYRGENNVQGDKTWETLVLGDFAELRKAGLTHPLMDEIEAKFNGHE